MTTRQGSVVGAGGALYVNETQAAEGGLPGVYLDETSASGSIVTGAGAADGAASVAGAGASLDAGAGAADGAASVAGAGVAAKTGAGEADGSSSVAGAGQVLDIITAAGAADGSASVAGAGAGPTLAIGAGAADGSSDVEGAGAAAHVGAGRADGTSGVSGAGAWVYTPDPFPALPGLAWPVHRRPTYRTVVARHPSGGDVRTPLWAFPLWEFEVAFEALAVSAADFPNLLANSLQTLMGFFVHKGGSQGTFLFTDPDFKTEAAAPLGTGDGSTKLFTFARRVGASIEPASWVTGIPTVYLDGVAQADATWGIVQPNVLSLNTAPGAGVAVTADFSYGFLCRFVDDTADFEQMMWNLWEAKTIKFRQVRATAA